MRDDMGNFTHNILACMGVYVFFVTMYSTQNNYRQTMKYNCTLFFDKRAKSVTFPNLLQL